MAYTEADLTKVRAAISSGIRRVTFADGRSTEYQNLDQLLAAEKAIEGALADGAAVGQRRRRMTVLRVARCR
ncbi:MAG TPA: hypothetical protein VF592_03600 [Sphingomonas sp.]|jgi:hypothetical protein|uniref:phage head-tail joining protein n=1 Tax=Sphingomonas sp. TaxID=28214 RepID=UPI002ED983FF